MIDENVLQPLHTEPAYKLAARTMRERILNGDIKVGEVLPSELALADLLQVNRSTVREAIRLLEENGIVSRKPGGKKLFVSIPKSTDLSGPITGAMILQKVTLNELFRTMHVLEPAIARDAALYASPEQIAALEANLAQTEAQAGDDAMLSELDIAFHNLMSEACNNRAILLSRQPISELFYPAFDAVMKRLNAGERMLAAHRHIVDAIRARDPKTAEDWMRRHIEDFRRGYELANLDIDLPIARLPRSGTED
ncbi:hypothetical protein ACMU_18280 [Actibacterium mucosum KCTC 23349]|uniref:HTH gntR-type domain-containing protein n=1 Tax=Actibacterium mucosum KCTC 23349 TaxID=1454373 RepID=A0A037ZHW2_9RHOB|nr:FCD domain-containing protein [Actibacterium mucosum]KAJ54375.1 hypothetical protein ACMU_18280 [Actibacterium mucosum KCTC 23349]